MFDLDLKFLVPFIKKHLTDKEVIKSFDILIEKYPIHPDGVKNIITLSKKNNNVSVSLATVDHAGTIVHVHKQTTVVEFIQELIKNI